MVDLKISDNIIIVISAENGLSQLRVVNCQGQLVHQNNIAITVLEDHAEVQLSLTSFEQGIYFVQGVQNEKVSTK